MLKLLLETFQADFGNLIVFENVARNTIKRNFSIQRTAKLSGGKLRHHKRWNGLMPFEDNYDIYFSQGVRKAYLTVNGPCILMSQQVSL